MKAIYLNRLGSPEKAFKIKEIPLPVIGDDEVLIKTNYSGLNFADVVARNGMYKEAPPLPFVPGYDVAGIVEQVGKNSTHIQPGDAVLAMTRFGGYAEYALTSAAAVAKIPAGIAPAAATALATQYCTAYYAAAEMVQLHKGDTVMVHAGAGGVGTALVQYAAYKQCTIIATAGSDSKLQYLSQLGVQHPVNYRTTDFANAARAITNGKGVDVIFDAIGGRSVKKGIKLLAPGGRMVCYGAAGMNDKNIFGKIGAALGFGFYHPVMLMMPSKAIIGVNMLKIADHQPQVLQRCLQQVVQLTEGGVFKPVLAKVFDANDIAAAHRYLEGRAAIGKVAIQW
jgi:NADPH2:quinone reductase